MLKLVSVCLWNIQGLLLRIKKSANLSIMLYIGIDPGKTGAAVALTQTGDVHSIMIGTDPYELMYFLQNVPHQSHIFIEKSQAMPKNGAVSMFNYGQNFGQILGITIALGFYYTLIPPRVWTKEMHKGLPKDITAKERSELRFEALYPDLDFRASERCKNNHLGLIDAILIAAYGLNSYKGVPKLDVNSKALRTYDGKVS